MRAKKIIVMGFMASVPIAGVIWQCIHYLVGLQRLGHEVYYFEDSARLPYDPVRQTVGENHDYACRTLGTLAHQFGFAGRWAYCPRYLGRATTAGLARSRMQEIYRAADTAVNLCGAQDLHEDVLECHDLIYLETDPVLQQVKVDQGDAAVIDYLRRHRLRFSFGENVGGAEFPVPLHGLDWLPTRQPVVTDFWASEPAPPEGALFSSVANWSTAGMKDIAWRGETYLWSKSAEFLRFIEAPRRIGEPVRLATTIPDQATRSDFQSCGWRLESPDAISIDWDGYRSFVQRSKGEFTVAKDQYVRLNTGWFSDRSACYLAAGRPVITQETGFSRLYGGQGGLFGFRTLDEIADAAARIKADYAAHAKAARELAREVFDAEAVLRSLLDRAGL